MPNETTLDTRYKVVGGSDSGHCCFAASILDTTKPVYGGGGKLLGYEAICECFSRKDAERIAAALNAAPSTAPQPK